MHYDGPSATIEDERNRQLMMENHARSSAWSQMKSEAILVLSFMDKTNMVKILSEEGHVYENILVIQPLESILFTYGEIDKIQNIHGILFYSVLPQDGFIILGNPVQMEIDKKKMVVTQPFYI